MITIHGRPTSSNVQIVLWAVGELGLSPELQSRLKADGVVA